MRIVADILRARMRRGGAIIDHRLDLRLLISYSPFSSTNIFSN